MIELHVLDILCLIALCVAIGVKIGDYQTGKLYERPEPETKVPGMRSEL